MASENERGKRETLADIVRKKRSMAAEIRANLSTVPVRREDQLLEADSLDREADRIEAAWRREREKAEAEADALSVGGIVEAARHKPDGNATAMREALRKIRKIADTNINECVGDYSDVRVIEIADAALSEPARNCDLYATYAEAADAHKEYATAYIMRASNKFDFPMEFDEWLFAPAAERKGDEK